MYNTDSTLDIFMFIPIKNCTAERSDGIYRDHVNLGKDQFIRNSTNTVWRKIFTWIKICIYFFILITCYVRYP